MLGKPSLNALLRWLIAFVAVPVATVLAMPAQAADDSDNWKLELLARVEAGIVLSESSDSEDELVVNGDGGYLRAAVGFELGDDSTTFRLEGDRIQVERFGSATGRQSYNRDRVTASVTQEIGDDWEVQLQGRIYDDLVTVESSDTDETSVSLRIEYEPVLAHRFRATVTWRDREYDDGAGPGGTSSNGDGVRVDLDYRHRLGRYHYVGLDLRAEEINSDNPDRSYTRESALLSYTHPLTSDLRIRPAIELRHTRFDGRLTPTLEVREDTQVVPEVELLWWPGNWRLEAEAKYIISDSNDPLRDREGYRFSLSVGYVF